MLLQSFLCFAVLSQKLENIRYIATSPACMCPLATAIHTVSATFVLAGLMYLSLQSHYIIHL